MGEIRRDIVILVDEKDQKRGTMSKAEAHKSPHLHRAFSVFLYKESQMLIQQRALHKYHSGGLWANTCCSHPREDETILQAAESRLQEETGIICPLNPLFSFEYCHQFSTELYEHEYDHVLVGEYDGAYQSNPEEVAEMRWISLNDLEKEMADEPMRFAPWFLIAAPDVIHWIKTGNLPYNR